MTEPTMPDLPIVAVLERMVDRCEAFKGGTNEGTASAIADQSHLRALIAAIREPVNYTRGFKIAQIGREA